MRIYRWIRRWLVSPFLNNPAADSDCFFDDRPRCPHCARRLLRVPERYLCSNCRRPVVPADRAEEILRQPVEIKRAA